MIAALACVAYDAAMLGVLWLQRRVNRLERWLCRAGDRWGL